MAFTKTCHGMTFPPIFAYWFRFRKKVIEAIGVVYKDGRLLLLKLQIIYEHRVRLFFAHFSGCYKGPQSPQTLRFVDIVVAIFSSFVNFFSFLCATTYAS